MGSVRQQARAHLQTSQLPSGNEEQTGWRGGRKRERDVAHDFPWQEAPWSFPGWYQACVEPRAAVLQPDFASLNLS